MKMFLLISVLLISSVAARAESQVIAFKDEAYVIDVKVDDKNNTARAEIRESKGTLPSVMQLQIKRKSKAPVKLDLKLVPNTTQAYEGKLHAPYGSYAAAAFVLRFDIGGSKRVLKPAK